MVELLYEFYYTNSYIGAAGMYMVFSVHTHVCNFETHVGLCPRLLIFFLAKFVASPTLGGI